MFSLQEKMVSIATFPYPFPFSYVFLSSKESPATQSGGVVWYTTAYDKTFLQVMFEGIADLVFKGLVGDLVVTVAFQSSREEWMLGDVCDGGVDMVR